MINELRVVNIAKSKDDSQKYFLAYKDKLFILDDKSRIKSLRSKIKKHIKDHPGLGTNSWSPVYQDDVHEFLVRMAEISPDVAVGEYYPETREIIVWNESAIQAKTSLIIKKIAAELGLDVVKSRHRDEPKYDDDKIVAHPVKKLIGGVPKVVFHGTNSHALKSILDYGLDAARGDSKFAKQGIVHDEHVFFTAVFEEALYYAFNAKQQDNKKWNNYPIVVELTIPDPSLLDPDYDADVSTTSARVFPVFQQNTKQTSDMKAMGLSRETGKWSYKGRIPTSFIRWIYYYKPFEHKWYRSKPETWTKLLSHYDWETLGYKLGLNGEDDL